MDFVAALGQLFNLAKEEVDTLPPAARIGRSRDEVGFFFCQLSFLSLPSAFYPLSDANLENTLSQPPYP